MQIDYDVLLAWSRGTAYLASLTPNRLSTAQLVMFGLAATCDRAGQPATYTALRDALGDTAGGSIKNTYKIFFEPTHARPDGLGWLYQQPCPLDGRVKHLRLSPKGKAIVETMLRAIHAL